MSNIDLPRQLEEAGIISREQAERLREIISRDEVDQAGFRDLGEPTAYEPSGR